MGEFSKKSNEGIQVLLSNLLPQELPDVDIVGSSQMSLANVKFSMTLLQMEITTFYFPGGFSIAIKK